jgi:predicted dehydrogenase
MATGWRSDATRSHGALSDFGSHCIDLLHWMVGDIGAVSAQLAVAAGRADGAGSTQEPANDTASLAVQFVDGAQGLIHVSTVVHVGVHIQQQRLIVHGEKGSLEFNFSLASGGTILVARADQADFEAHSIPDDIWDGGGRRHPSFMETLETFRTGPIADRLFIDAILDDLPLSPSFEDGMKSQAVVDAALASARAGCQVAVEPRTDVQTIQRKEIEAG